MSYIKPKPIMRMERYADFYSGIHNAVDKIIKNPLTIPYQNCLNCKSWDYGQDLCKKFNAKPPTEIIVYSCEAYEDDDDIPF